MDCVMGFGSDVLGSMWNTGGKDGKCLILAFIVISKFTLN